FVLVIRVRVRGVDIQEQAVFVADHFVWVREGLRAYASKSSRIEKPLPFASGLWRHPAQRAYRGRRIRNSEEPVFARLANASDRAAFGDDRNILGARERGNLPTQGSTNCEQPDHCERKELSHDVLPRTSESGPQAKGRKIPRYAVRSERTGGPAIRRQSFWGGFLNSGPGSEVAVAVPGGSGE